MSRVIISKGKAYDNEQITVSSTAIGFTASKVKHESNDNIHPILASFSISDADIRIQLDGTDPTSTTGYLARSGTSIEITGESDIRNFKAIRDDSTDAVLDVIYFKD